MSVITAIPSIGELIAGRYQLDRMLGEGGMGLVYAGKDQVLGREVALKVLWPGAASDPQSRARFLREARVASAMGHPNAVQIYDFGEDEGRLFIAMELLQGTPLGHFMHRQPRGQVALDDIHRIAVRIAEVLEVAHRIPLVHRDLKPENIFLDRSAAIERVVVLDFGLAFMLEPGGDESVGRLTRDNMASGTPWYMSPEQACNTELAPASDVYALGCVLFEMITGKAPFDDPAPAKILTQHLYSPVPPLRPLRPEVPAALEELVVRMMAKQPDARPAIEAVRQRLENLEAAAPDARERARDVSYLSDREARMVERPAVDTRARTHPNVPVDAIRLAIAAHGDRGFLAGLAVSGIAATAVDPALIADDRESLERDFDAVFVPASALESLPGLCDGPIPVIAETAPGQIDRVTELLRAGVAEVVTTPVEPDELAAKAGRAVRKSRSRRRRQR